MATTLTPRLPVPRSSPRRQPPGAPSRPHLIFLDGIRGLTAFYVVVHHVYTHIMSHDPPQMWGTAAYLSRWLNDGPLAVSVFIVVSGYCLMLPAAHDTSRPLSPARFLRRRITRILPPYYAALALSLLFIAAAPIMQPHTQSPWDNAVPAFTPGRLISHLLLLHNATEDWLFAIDPPMWSIAVEWQVYFLFIFLLYPLWRRFGIAKTVTIALAVGFIPAALNGPFSFNFFFVGLFAMGMAGAVVTASHATLPTAPAIRLPTIRDCSWIWVLALILVVATPAGVDLVTGYGSVNVLLGILTVATIVALAWEAHCGAAAHRSLSLRILESRPLVKLGAFSYSLYLIHFPIVSFCDRVLSARVHSYLFPIAMYATAIPLSVAIAYLFHLVFERPFMRRGVQAAR